MLVLLRLMPDELRFALPLVELPVIALLAESVPILPVAVELLRLVVPLFIVPAPSVVEPVAEPLPEVELLPLMLPVLPAAEPVPELLPLMAPVPPEVEELLEPVLLPLELPVPPVVAPVPELLPLMLLVPPDVAPLLEPEVPLRVPLVPPVPVVVEPVLLVLPVAPVEPCPLVALPVVPEVGPVPEVFSRPIDLAVAASVGVETVVPGEIVDSSDGLVTVRVGASQIRVAQPSIVARSVFACIRAEDVTLETSPRTEVSARNQLAGRVTSMQPEGAVVRVTVDCGFSLSALITRPACAELGLRENSAITAVVKATAVHLIPRENDS